MLALGSPVWLPLAIAAAAVALSLYVSLWAVIISLWSVFAALIAAVPVSVISGAACMGSGRMLSGVSVLAVGIVSAGLAIFAFCGCKAATKGALVLTRKMVLWMKKCFNKKEAAQ